MRKAFMLLLVLDDVSNDREIARNKWSRNTAEDPLRIRQMNCTPEPLWKCYQKLTDNTPNFFH